MHTKQNNAPWSLHNSVSWQHPSGNSASPPTPFVCQRKKIPNTHTQKPESPKQICVRYPERVPLQGLPEDCVKVMLEPDGPHLRYSAETAKHQPRKCHSRCLMPPAIATNAQTCVHKCTERQQRRKWHWVTVTEQMGFKFALSVTVSLNKSSYYNKYLHVPDNLLHALTLEESARWLCSCLMLVCFCNWISTTCVVEKPLTCVCMWGVCLCSLFLRYSHRG